MTNKSSKKSTFKRLIKEVAFVILKEMPFGRTADDILGVVKNINTSQKDLDKQVEEAVGALTKSTQLITELEGSLGERAKELEKLQIEYKRVSQLASLTEEQSKAVTEQLEQAVGKNRPKQLLIAFLLNLTAGLFIFILGVFASDWVKSLPDVFQKEAKQSVLGSTEKTKPVEEPEDVKALQSLEGDKTSQENEIDKDPQE